MKKSEAELDQLQEELIKIAVRNHDITPFQEACARYKAHLIKNQFIIKSWNPRENANQLDIIVEKLKRTKRNIPTRITATLVFENDLLIPLTKERKAI